MIDYIWIPIAIAIVGYVFESFFSGYEFYIERFQGYTEVSLGRISFTLPI